jgi:hypothetical protein
MRKKLNGNKLYRKSFSRKDIIDIRESIIAGCPLLTIGNQYKVSIELLQDIFSELIQGLEFLNIKLENKKEKILGNRQETYYSEEELLLGLPTYIWKDLSITEKQFYKNYGRKFRNSYDRCNKYDYSLVKNI